MRTLPLSPARAALVAVALLAALQEVSAGQESFDAAPIGALPPEWTVAVTGEGKPEWTVETESSAPSRPQVLRQSAKLPKASFPLCLRADDRLRDGYVETRFKTVSGEIDQAAGVVWRYQNPTNYYVCRANALENNVVLYKVVDGKRSALDIVGRQGGYGVEVPVAPGVWQALRVEFRASRFTVRLNRKVLFEVEDATLAGAGQVGLWTKADSVTVFDDFRWEAGGKETPSR